MCRTLTRKVKNSGIKWIGDVPEEWGIAQVKHLFEIGRGRVISKEELQKDSETGYPVYSSQTKNDGVLGYIETYDFDNPQLTWTTDGANAGTVFLRKGKHNCTNVCGTLNTKLNIEKQINLEYVYYALYVGAPYYKRKDTNGYKIMNNEMAVIKLPLPEKEIQNKISDKINQQTKYIVKLINESKQSIEELKKYKQSIITEAITKGLTPDEERKDSETEWIGEVPKSWRIIKLNQLFSIKKNIANEVGYDVLSVTQNGLRVRDVTKNEGQMSADYSKYQIVEKDNFVMNHMDLLTGWIDIAKKQGVTSPDYRVFYNKQTELVSNEYFLYVFQTAYTNKIFYGLGQGVSNVGRWRLQTDKFLNFYVPLPSFKEQQEIVSYLNQQTSYINKLIDDKTKIIEELENYKKSLIYEYVTGKKEV